MHTVDTIMKDIVNLRVHIAPVGFEIDRIIIPAVRMKADKVWLKEHDKVDKDKTNMYRPKIEKELAKNRVSMERVDLVMKVQNILKAQKYHGKYKEKSCVTWRIKDADVKQEDMILEGEFKELTSE